MFRGNNYMSKDTRSASRITTKESYLSLFPDDKASNSERKRFQALKEAQEIRKFEINLYWKRTGFFWAFITVIYTALFHVLCKYIECSYTYDLFIPAISALSGLGFFFSVAWHMVNKGSKFWQKNWEKHVSLLERSEIGPLYDVYLNPKGTMRERLCPTKAFDFSVSKVNMWASAVMFFCSFSGCVGIMVWLVLYKKACPVLTLAPCIIIAVFSFLMMFISDGNNDIEIEGSELEYSELNMIHINQQRKSHEP